jgi:hypothetical protein
MSNKKIEHYFTRRRKEKRVRHSESDSATEEGRDSSDMEGAGDIIGRMSLAEVMKSFSDMVDSKGLATKDDVRILSEAVTEIRQENSQLKKEVKELKNRCESLEKDIDMVLNKIKENNLIFKGIQLKKEEDPKYTIQRLCAETLGIEGIEINKAFFLGNSNLPGRPILEEFQKEQDKMKIIKHAYKLKGSQIIVQHNFHLIQGENEENY